MPATPFILHADRISRRGGSAASNAASPAFRLAVWSVKSNSVEWVAPQTDADPDESLPSLTTRLVDRLRAEGYAGEPLVLTVSASTCLCASIRIDDLPAGDRRAMLYRFEERLPIAAEEVSADFAIETSRNRALGCCVDLAGLRELLVELDRQGVSVASVMPASFLLIQAESQAGQSQSEHDTGSRLYVAAGLEGQSADLVLVKKGRPVAWRHCPADGHLTALADIALRRLAVSVSGHLRSLIFATAVAPTLVVKELPAQVLAAISAELGEPLAATSYQPGNRLPLLQGFLDQSESPWIELRRGPLALRRRTGPLRRALQIALVATAASLLIMAAVGFWRAQQYRTLAEASRAELLSEMRESFPGWFENASTAEVRAVLLQERSVHASAQSPAQTGGKPAAERSALQVLHDVLDRVPAELPLQIERSSFDEKSFEIIGKARSYEDVDRVAAAVRAAGLTVPPPQARKAGDGNWTFTLRGGVGTPVAIATPPIDDGATLSAALMVREAP